MRPTFHLIAALYTVSNPHQLERSCPVQFQALDLYDSSAFSLVSDSLSSVASHGPWVQLLVSAIVPALGLYLPALIFKKFFL